MDPICHSLVGAALSSGGLKRWTGRATAILVVAANAPDVDVVAIAVGRSLELRRGVTHGIVALALWPFVLGIAWRWWDRRRPGLEAVRFWPAVGLSAIGVLTHSFLDFLNSYGLRWLIPPVDQWFYGDSLFIVDPWLYAALGIGIWLSRRKEALGRPDPCRPARLGLAVALVYIGGMMGSTTLARTAVAAELEGTSIAGARFMATAVPVNPFVKDVVIDAGPAYRLGRYRFFGSPRLAMATVVDKTVSGRGQVDQLRSTREGRAFLHWSRFPVIRPVEDSQFRIYDLRYSNGGRGWAALEFTTEPAVTPR